ncbi:MAG: EAL domain-containing protein [Tenericutes bacterium]|nr:EAL domain-containing protein [Mycoplasmatota bacterium]
MPKKKTRSKQKGKKKRVIKENSLIRKIGSLTVFLDAVFLVIILGTALFLYYFNLNSDRVDNSSYQNQVVETMFADIVNDVKSDVHKLAQDEDIIDYIKYINSGNNPVILEADVNYNILLNYLNKAGSIVDYQKDDLYDLAYIATDIECSSGTDGCGVTHDGQLSLSDWQLTKRPWYTSLSANDGVLTSPYVDGLTGDYVISYVEIVYDNQAAIGFVGIDIKLESLAVLLNEFTEERIHVNSEIIVVSDLETSPQIMYFSNDQDSEYTMEDINAIEALDVANGYGELGLNYIISNPDLSEYESFNLISGKYIVMHSKIENTPFTTITLYNLPLGFEIEIIFIILLAFSIGAIALVTFLIRKSIKNSLKPINIILSSIEQIKNGNYETHVNIREASEFKKIGDAINMMSTEIDQQLKATYDTLAYDMLTGLKSRASATAEVDETIFKSNKRAAVCLIQVGNLKNINVTKGNLIGDNLIKAIADELRKALRTETNLFSNSGNEFVYIKDNFNSLEQVEYTLSQLLIHFKDPIIVKNLKAEIKFYIGVSIYPTDGRDLNELIKKCDTALFKANEFGNKKIIFYNEKIARSVSYQAEITERLSQAVDKGQIYLKFQPLIRTNNEVYGFEALARWNSPTLGEIGPTVFIANAEESYLIIPLGTWILRKACETQVLIRKKLGKDFVMSVNISPVQILQRNFMTILRNIVKETDINPNFLTLEITEGVFIEASVMLEDTIEDLHSMGIKLSLDDFGTGYASLTYLRQIKFDNLKIDKSFVDGIFGNEKDHRIISTIVNLVHNLDMIVIAEGVETRRQYEYLREISTDVIQGYIFSKPLIIDDLYEFLDKFHKLSKTKRVEYFSQRNESRE